MQNIFQFVMYFVFGKHWLLFDLRHGYKATLFINELELDMHRAKLRACQDDKRAIEKELEELEATTNYSDEELIAMLPEEDKESKKALYDLRKLKDGERAEAIGVLRNRIASAENDIASANGELQKGYAMTYQNRMKYDFIRTYKPKTSYGDKNFGKEESE